MAERLSPGVFIEERQVGATVIQAVSTSTYATAGFTQKGPINEATLVTSLEDFFNKFGGFTTKSLVPTMVTAFYSNGGTRAFVTRVTPTDATTATGDIATQFRLTAVGPGEHYNKTRGVLRGNENSKTASTATFTLFDLDIQEETTDGEGDFVTIETFSELELTDDESASYILTTVNEDSEVLTVSELTPGIPTAFNSTQVTGEVIGTGTGVLQTFTDTLANPIVAENTVTVRNAAVAVATDDGVGRITGTGVSGTIDYDTGDISVFFSTPPGSGNSITVDYYQEGVSGITVDLTGGSDGTLPLGRNDLTNPALEANQKGIYAFNKIEEFLNMGLPDSAGSVSMITDMIAYAERRKDVFVIVSPARSLTAQEVLNFKRVTLNSQSSYGAMYYPWITIADPLKDNKSTDVPPVGHVAGIYARTDISRNVAKAPAGVIDGRLNFAIGLERTLSMGERDLIYPANINPLISTPQTGRVVWGSRTLSTTGDFTQVSHRRLFIFLEKSVFNSTHDFVFEPIGAGLYSSIKGRLTGFLNTLFLEGYFAGDTPEQAFFVIVDDSNNPQSVKDARTVIIDVGIAAAEPAEFVVFRFQRKLAE